MIGAVATRDNTAGDGYSLIELLTVLAVVAVLTTLAVPSYQHVVSKVRRAEGRTALLRLMQQQEQIYTQRMRYVTFTATGGDSDVPYLKWFSGESAVTSFYELRAERCPDQTIEACVLLKALPGTTTVNASYLDARCGVLQIDSLGRRSAGAEGCW